MIERGLHHGAALAFQALQNFFAADRARVSVYAEAG